MKEEAVLREHAMARLLAQQETMSANYMTDEELDNLRYECLRANS